MAQDNYVVREKYNGLEEVNGQLVPKRGEVKPEEIVAIDSESDEAVRNGGGDENRPRRRRRTVEED